MFRLALALYLGLTSAAHAQSKKHFYTRQDCAPLMVVMQDMVSAYSEQPLFTGKAVVQNTQGKPYEGAAMIFVNQDTGTWTVVTLYGDGMACVTAFGVEFQPYTE